MKKMIAIVLAVALSLSMASVGLAATVNSSIYQNATLSNYAVAPGTKIVFEASDFVDGSGNPPASGYFTSEYFTVSVKYNKGANLVESIKFDDDDGELIMTLKKNNSLKAPNIPNIDIKEMTIKAKKKGSGFDRGDVFNLDSAFLGGRYIGYVVNALTGGVLEVGDDVDLNEGDSGLIKFDDRSGTRYGTSAFRFGNIAYGEMRVYEDDQFFVSYDEEPDYDILKKYPDAELRFVNLAGEFNASMSFELYADKDEYVYELVNGKLKNTSLKWNDDVSAYTGKVRNLPTYVISDTKLKISTTTDGSSSSSNTNTNTNAPNPSTGTNDMVGVAVALAAVSLVAAGAVSLKKK